jgi:hypothetical protein
VQLQGTRQKIRHPVHENCSSMFSPLCEATNLSQRTHGPGNIITKTKTKPPPHVRCGPLSTAAMSEHHRKTFFELPLEIRERFATTSSMESLVHCHHLFLLKGSTPRLLPSLDCAAPTKVKQDQFLRKPRALVWDEMKRKIGTIFFCLIHHRRILLPWTYEAWSDYLATPYPNLKTLTIFVGLSRLGAAK